MSRSIKRESADLLVQMSELGLALTEEQKQIGRISGATRTIDGPAPQKFPDKTDGRQHLWITAKQANDAKERAENPQPKAECYMERIPQGWIDKWRGTDITKDNWAPARPDLHTRDKEFRRFIASHIPRFDRIVAYELFYLYIEQALRWLDEGTTIEDYEGDDERDYAMREMQRIDENKLYGANKYGYIKDDEYPGGWRKYTASTPQALLLWALDAGFSVELGKGRQAAITSTAMLREALTMLTRASYKGVLVTDDVDFTGKAIFSDKLQACYKALTDRNPWMRPLNVPGWSAKKITFDWSTGSRKDEKGSFTSDFSLAASNETQTINGTTPSIVVFDESQNIPTYQDIKLEARPTMLSNINGVIRIRRQLLAYGTGSRKQMGKGSFENEYKGSIYKWNKGEDTSAFIPIFFDWTCRPGMTAEVYMGEYDFYLNRQDDDMKGLSREERMSVFYSAYPSSPDDMFLTSHKTVVPILIIKRQQDKIIELGVTTTPGRFEPIFDQGRAMPAGSYFPYFVTGSRFVPMPEDIEAPARMFLDREANWLYRYYQGTDPIQSASGTSKFGSVIWDNVGTQRIHEGQMLTFPTFACVLNDRQPVVEETFNQSILMGMYYRNYGQTACKELVEINQGQSYIQWKGSPWFNQSDSMWYRAALPSEYRGGQHIYGIDLKGGKNSRKHRLLHDLEGFAREYADSVMYYEWWTQLRNMEVEEKPDGAVEFGTKNKNVYNDDMVFGGIYSHISCRADGKDPKKIDIDVPMYEWVETKKFNRQTLEPYTVRERVKAHYA